MASAACTISVTPEATFLDSMASSGLLLAVGLCMVYKHKSDSSQPHIKQGKYSRQMSSICHNLVKHIPANQLHASIGLIRQIYKCHTFTFLISTNMWTRSRNKTIRRSHKVCNIISIHLPSWLDTAGPCMLRPRTARPQASDVWLRSSPLPLLPPGDRTTHFRMTVCLRDSMCPRNNKILSEQNQKKHGNQRWQTLGMTHMWRHHNRRLTAWRTLMAYFVLSLNGEESCK